MQALVFEAPGKPLAWRQVPRPRPRPGEVLVRPRGNGLCATDLKIIDGHVSSLRLPAILGHEFSGEVVESGEGVTDVQPGMHVVAHANIGCQRCIHCRRGTENYCASMRRLGFELDGGFAEYVAIPAKNALPIRSDVSFSESAFLSGSVATPLHGLRSKARVQLGEAVVILGLGGLGIHAAQLAKAMGARVIVVGRDDSKLAVASQYGADATINSSRDDVVASVRDLTAGAGADVVVETAGGSSVSQVLEQALNCLARAGRLLVLGYGYGQLLTVDTATLIYGQWQLIGSRASTQQDLADVIKLVEGGVIKPVVEAAYPIHEFETALTQLRGSSPVGRIVLLS